MAESSYSARHLTVLEGLEAVRKRPGMYIGSTDSRGLMHCLWEIIDNSVDEALAGHGNEISIELHSDGSVTVRDNGRGVPVDIEPKSGLSGVELVFTKLHAGGKFGGGGYAASGGLHGVGASVVNALSARLDVEVDRDGKTWAMSFRHGEPGIFSGDAPDSTFTPFENASELRVVGKVKKGVTGTRVRYWADPQIFLREAEFETDSLVARARQTAFLVPGLAIDIVDARGEETTHQHFAYEGGISEFVDYLATDGPVSDTWRITDTGHFSETVPVIDEAGNMVSREVKRECEIDIAMRWGTGYETNVKSFVNIIATPKGGTHVAGFEQGLTKFFRKQIETNSRKLKAGSDRPDKDDILTGLTAVIMVRVPEPQFEGQTKEVLGTAAVRAIVAKVVTKHLDERFSSAKRHDKIQCAAVLEKMVSEMKSRISLRAQRDTQRRKTSLESSSLPAKLIDCRSKSVEGTELFIVEGDSALGTARPARDSEFQALLPIRGKILNVQKASVADMLSNRECGDIIKVIGAGSGRDFDLASARYGRVIIMSDADVDGAHIRTLLLTLFFRYMRPMLEAGRVFAAVPPLHRVIVQNAGRKPNDVIYTYSEQELQSLLADLRKRGKKYVEPIQRYKGLGEMDADQLAETTMDREHRMLRRVRVSDAHEAALMFELLMGNEVAPRKEFIVDNADEMDRDRIDA
ncbi:MULTISPECIES: type IIA DNA topoisomerase subunit B [unclassified Leucobacter]|uniref:DNA gyrase/topoisomerase IV subunit B n=1 Tax=unclassified Leucobacter TaxID=2621730 RepID=UPI00165E0139|nr:MULTISPECIES: DNA topoisomerase IV subunit B [unclassified Leucobacter]MBC9926747.1 type IIA DNA topoisomerase subunit B [Leucobacter sp. cx-169]MBC9935291.1 type IIA DNA topoisomerase subunit B [Leucobacter sp. cx-87]